MCLCCYENEGICISSRPSSLRRQGSLRLDGDRIFENVTLYRGTVGHKLDMEWIHSRYGSNQRRRRWRGTQRDFFVLYASFFKKIYYANVVRAAAAADDVEWWVMTDFRKCWPAFLRARTDSHNLEKLRSRRTIICDTRNNIFIRRKSFRSSSSSRIVVCYGHEPNKRHRRRHRSSNQNDFIY